jgi:5-oxopent-3-ene-1,2,5-tricarboxylate decarboxylase/2-hydroxyhepta-2,4-diene-1,7-dioate isomerase
MFAFRTGAEMPQITIEYSRNAADHVDMAALMLLIHETVHNSGLFAKGLGIRSRLVPHQVFRFGNGDPENAFVEIRLRIAHGRSDPQRAALGAAIFEAARSLAQSALADAPFCLSVDIEEINPVGAFTDNGLKRLFP